MENKRKIIGRKQPFEIKAFDSKIGDLWELWTFNNKYYINNSGLTLPAEIVEPWEAVYEEVKLEDLPKMGTEALADKYINSPKKFFDFIKDEYPDGIIILPE